ncbi:MAG: Eco57I restriction-modification methylase domain-containing protein [Candidatus Thorarchaeota archaeon]
MNKTNLLLDFGPNSELAKNTIRFLHRALEESLNMDDEDMSQEKKQLLDHIVRYDKRHLLELGQFYKIPGKEPRFVLFGIQTYFALFIKLFAAEVAHLRTRKHYEVSYLKNIVSTYSETPEKLKCVFEDLESGKLFLRLIKVRNLIDQSIFSWYLNEWSGELANVILKIASRLSEYNFNFKKEKSKTDDVFKSIYLELIPKAIRHKLGEFYTPHWLVQFSLDKIGYNLASFKKIARNTRDLLAPFRLRVIDPSCGSGSFLIEVLNRLRSYAERYGLENEMRKVICENIVGIDLNPLAVLATKANYLISVLDLFPLEKEIGLPVFLADAVSPKPSEVLSSLGEFDFLIGNPPWLLMDRLPVEYREGMQSLWEYYGLFTLKGYQAQHGGGKKDFSTLFTYVCLDRYLKSSGKVSFLITQSVFKTVGAGEGFRKFKVNGKPYRVTEVHDFGEIRPFKGVNNRAVLLILEGGHETVYPVNYMIWMPTRKMDRDYPWPSFIQSMHPIRLVAIPSISTNILSPWITVPIDVLPIVKKIYGRSEYSSKEGINSGGLNGVFWIRPMEILSAIPRSVPLRKDLLKLPGSQKTLAILAIQNVTHGMKKKVKKVFARIEDFFVYPLLKSRNVERWKINNYNYALQMQDPVKRKGYDEDWVINNFPLTYAYLREFKQILLRRKSKVVQQLIQRGPFYSMYSVGVYTYSKFKVVWSQMGSNLQACVISRVQDKYLGNKLILPEHVLAYIPVEDENEAHYLCAILNSMAANLVLRSIARGTKSFGTPRLVDKTIRIHKFDQKNQSHMKLARLSLKAHNFARLGSSKLIEIEKKIEMSIANLYKITPEEYLKIQQWLEIIS